MSTSPYNEAGNLMQKIIMEKKSIKTLAFSKSKLKCKKSTYAQVCNTIQHKPILDSILNHNSGYLRKGIQFDKARNRGMVYVLLYELLFGKYKSIRGGGMLKRCIMKFEKDLNITKNEIVKDSKNQYTQSTASVPVFPRYVRVNTLKATVDEVVTSLTKSLLVADSSVDDVKHTHLYQDEHVPDLLVLSPKSSIQWYGHDLVTTGKVILQDKSSCFSALALVHGHHHGNNDNNNNDNDNDAPMGDFIDATAAPGNKTLHLAALIYDKILNSSSQRKNPKKKSKKVKVFAFDRSSSRIEILRERVSSLSPSVSLNDDEKQDTSTSSSSRMMKHKSDFPVEICPRHEDFLKVDPNDPKYKNVKSILLDPSCSGSGVVNSPDRIADSSSSTVKKEDEKRIETLSNFQLMVLKHAMSFPQVCRIVYSTCSIHQRENEDVVAASMQETNNEITDESTKWDLVSPMALTHWKRRGYKVDSLTQAQSDCLIRVNGMDGDDTNGFFVSYFERKFFTKETETNDIKSLVSVPSGVKSIYNGDFPLQITHNESNDSDLHKDSNEDSQKDSNETSHEDKNEKDVPPTKKATTGTKVIKPVPKKVAKKMEWKRRQNEQKASRLLKMKAKNSQIQSTKNDKSV
mmetsp:Transcript_15210/g.17708  ORF Transcript_15210/g.17708 Transcript_15210/m.17708 type:complete len:630 (+) Transcript_15210:144-2033(+)